MVRALLILALLASASCVRGAGTYRCAADNECTLDRVSGVCITGFCAFPDPSCEGGLRYGVHSGPNADVCVAAQEVSTEVTIGGTVTNLVGMNLVLRNNGGDDLLVSASGPFEFSDALITGALYDVTVAAQPSDPVQVCTVENGTGTAGTMDVTNVAVDCATATYTVGGTVLGLIGSGLVLTNNGGDDRAVTGSGNVAFTFATGVASGSTFDVQIKTQPSGQTCSVSGNTGTVGAANITSVVVNCMAGTYTVGGSVTGLQGTVVLSNGSDTATVTANGTFAFPTPVATSTMYNVTVGTQPSYPPRSQTCTVTNGTGTVGTSNVTSVSVTCTTNAFTVGGTVTALTGTLVIRNGTDMLSVTGGTFTFGTSVLSGNTYNVQIVTQPSGQTCTITGNATGTVGNSNVTNVTISCGMAGADPGILCGGGVYCDPAADEICCIDGNTSSCTTSCNGGGSRTPVKCDTQADCAAAGSPNLVCCGTIDGDTLYNTYCANPTLCTPPKAYYCDPNIANPCPQGGTCTATSIPFPGYYRCL